MCGIAGIVSSSSQVDSGQINLMTDILRHRGPDDRGIYLNNHVGLGNRRLTIIDLSPLGHQPMFSPDRQMCIVYNGEIYNYRQLRQELLKKGYSFQSQSDTEVILTCYREYGIDCLRHLRGMFAFALWDESKKTLFVARDRIGKKPLYYASDGHSFAFASEIKALLTLPWVSRELDPVALNEYFALQYIPAPRTAFRMVSKLPPGHFLVAKDYATSHEIRRYWRPRGEDDRREETIDPVQHGAVLLEEAVRLRLVSDVEVGVLLSGGIDSSLIASIASRNSSSTIKTFSVGFNKDRLNELPHAHRVAESIGSEHYSIVADEVTPETFLKVIEHIDEPLGDPACVPTYLIAGFAAQHVKVVLSGEGGDEVFGGYPYYVLEQFVAPLFSLPASARKRVAMLVRAGVLPVSARLANRLAKVLESHREASVSRWTNVFGSRDRQRFYSNGFLSAVKEYDPTSSIYEAFAQTEERGFLGRGMEVDLRTWLPDDLLMKVDKMTMANSLEARTPFLDHKLVEYIGSLETRYKVRGKRTKILLKQIAGHYLPLDIINRKKHGFEVPIVHWMLNNFRDLAEESFSEEGLRQAGVFNVPAVSNLWRTVKERGESPSPRMIWLIFCFSQWSRQYKCRF